MKKLAALFLFLALLIPTRLWALAGTHAIATANTTNGTSYASGSFTPAANDLLVAFVVASGTVATGTMTSSVGGQTFTKITSFVYNGSLNTIYAFVGDQLVTAVSQTVTFDCTGDTATGAVVSVLRVSGMSRTGLSAILQSAGQSNQAGGGTPAPAFGASALTGNLTAGVVGNGANPAGLTPPTSWTEANDTGYPSPNIGSEYVYRDSGFTGTTITWGSASGSEFGSLILELDASAAPTASCPKRLTTMGVGC